MNKMVLYLIIVCTIFLFSCSKDKDEEKPIITMSSPMDLQQINGGDTINISGTITDNQNVKRVTVTLRDEYNTSVLSTVIKLPESNSTTYSLNILYPFNDLQMASGQYDFNITASDGENTSTKYIPIAFKEFEKKREGIFVLGNSGNFSSIYLLDTNFNSSFYSSINGDFIGAAVDLYNQQLINVSKTTGSISASAIDSKVALWSVPVLGSPPVPYYTGFCYDNQNIYLGKREGGVQGYDKNGNPNFATGTSSNYYMESLFIHNDEYVVIEERSIVTSSSRNISLSWLYSGVTVLKTTLISDVKGMFSRSANSIVLLANDPSLNARAIFLDVSTGGKSSPFNIASLGEINDCVQVGNGLYLVAASGKITFVDVNNFSTLGYLSNVPADKIWFDNLANELYVADGNMLSIYDYSSRTLKGNYSHTEDIEEVMFWYNK
jgi:hypothetical protein